MPRDNFGMPEIDEYTRKLDTNPESLVFVPLAEAYRKSGMLDEAIETCQKGLKHHPTYMSARMVLGRSFMEKGLLDEAAEEFRKVAAADVNNIMAHSLLAQICMKQNQFADAIKEYQKVLTLNPEDATAQEMLNRALELARQHNGPKPTASGPKDSDKKQNLNKAEELSKQGDIDNAIKIYQLILEADPENLVVRQRLKDLELQKAQSLTGVGQSAKPAPDANASLKEYRDRDNDKITSDDILSVMKDTTEKTVSPPKSVPPPPSPPPPVATPKPQAPPVNPKPVPPVAPPVSAPPRTVEPKAKPVPVPAPKPTPSSAPAAAPVSGPAPAPAPGKIPALERLMQTEGILGSMLLDLQGKVLSSIFNHLPKDEKEIAETVTLIFGKTEKSVQAMDYGKQVNQILVTGEKGQIIFSKVGNKILLVLADENINLGKMRLAMNEVVKALRQ